MMKRSIVALSALILSVTAVQAGPTVICVQPKNNAVSGILLWHLPGGKSLAQCRTYSRFHQSQFPPIEIPKACKFDIRSPAKLGKAEPLYFKPPEPDATGETCDGEVNYQCTLWCE
jgi:hypothetical protein